MDPTAVLEPNAHFWKACGVSARLRKLSFSCRGRAGVLRFSTTNDAPAGGVLGFRTYLRVPTRLYLQIDKF